MVTNRMEPDEFGLDELVVDNVDFVHMERMRDDCMWVGLYFKDGQRLSLFLEGKGAVIVTDGDGNMKEFFEGKGKA